MLGSFNFVRRYSRFFIIAGLLALSVPAALTINFDNTAQAASSRGGGGGGGGQDGGGDGASGTNSAARCLGGICAFEVPCTNGDCGDWPPPECEGSDCGPPTTGDCVGSKCDTPDKIPTPRITYMETPAGCEQRICSVEGDHLRCHQKLAAEKFCAPKKKS